MQSKRRCEATSFALLSLHARIRSLVLQGKAKWEYSVNFDTSSLRIIVERPELLASSELHPKLLTWALAFLCTLVDATIDDRVSLELGAIGEVIVSDDGVRESFSAVKKGLDAAGGSWWYFTRALFSLAMSEVYWPMASTLLLHYFAVHPNYCTLAQGLSLLPALIDEVRVRAESAVDLAISAEVVPLAREIESITRRGKLTAW